MSLLRRCVLLRVDVKDELICFGVQKLFDVHWPASVGIPLKVLAPA